MINIAIGLELVRCRQQDMWIARLTVPSGAIFYASVRNCPTEEDAVRAANLAVPQAFMDGALGPRSAG